MAHVRVTNVNHPIPQELMSEKAVSRLVARHGELENELAELTAGPTVDWDGVKLIKRRKLEVAEQLEALKRRLQ
ncbi:MAG: hypothetical protein EON60_01190 [Alphaproteobacteria bacterium]|nr:MAG: hypothetical protein EON60_01190 [Alphaproteobacteria bacterium]